MDRQLLPTTLALNGKSSELSMTFIASNTFIAVGVHHCQVIPALLGGQFQSSTWTLAVDRGIINVYL